MKRLVRFPWKVFWKFFFIQVAAFNVLMLVIVSILDLRYPMLPFVYNEVLLNFFIFSSVVSFFISYRFTRPLHKLTLKALRISSRRDYGDLIEGEEDLLEDSSELSDLDLALTQIHNKMRKRKALLLQTQEESQAFMSAVAEGLVTVSLDEKLLYFNSQFATQFLTQDQLAKGNIWLKDALRSVDVHDGFVSTIETGKLQRFTVKLNTLSDALPRYFAVSVNPIRNEKTREVYGVVGIFHDITELKMSEQIRIDFVGNASHELRTPLTSIKGYIETLREDAKHGDYELAPKFLDIVSRNIDRLIDLVNDLLNLSTLESQGELRLSEIEPFVISEQVVSELAVLASGKNIVLRISGEAPVFKGDSRKIEQVLRNLISNAIKFIPSHSSVEVRWSQERDTVVLRVMDDGPGISEEHLSRLFERFYRVDRGRTRDAGGTGLGLAIVKHIMQSHGGTISVKSSQASGSEFICSFPMYKK